MKPALERQGAVLNLVNDSLEKTFGYPVVDLDGLTDMTDSESSSSTISVPNSSQEVEDSPFFCGCLIGIPCPWNSKVDSSLGRQKLSSSPPPMTRKLALRQEIPIDLRTSSSSSEDSRESVVSKPQWTPKRKWDSSSMDGVDSLDLQRAPKKKKQDPWFRWIPISPDDDFIWDNSQFSLKCDETLHWSTSSASDEDV